MTPKTLPALFQSPFSARGHKGMWKLIPCLIGSDVFSEALRATEQVSHQDASKSEDFSTFGVNESRLQPANRYTSQASYPQTLNSFLSNMNQS